MESVAAGMCETRRVSREVVSTSTCAARGGLLGCVRRVASRRIARRRKWARLPDQRLLDKSYEPVAPLPSRVMMHNTRN